MGRTSTRVLGIVASVVAATSAVVDHNVIGAVVFGAATLVLIWFAFRPAKSPDRPVRPLRGMIVFALVLTIGTAALVLTAITDADTGSALVGAVIGAPLAVYLWALVAAAWRRGWRWSSVTTYAALQGAAAAGQRLEAPPRS